jgi:predicted regulator of Ras-like GTPase activity (Roadblock/LC7/MglB family)
MPTGGVYEIIVEFEQALIVVMGIPDGSTLAVSATPPYDIGVVAYEMAILTDRTAWPRSA